MVAGLLGEVTAATKTIRDHSKTIREVDARLKNLENRKTGKLQSSEKIDKMSFFFISIGMLDVRAVFSTIVHQICKGCFRRRSTPLRPPSLQTLIGVEFW